MSWATAPLWAVSVLYAVQVGAFLAAGKPAMALTVTGYVVANIGLLWAAR